MATVIVLNGTSSSGKTTIARAVQEIARRRFLNYSIDNILYALPARDLGRIVRGEDIADLRLPELVRAFYACVRQLLELEHDLIIDHAITAAYHLELLREAIASHEALIVGLDCPPEVLRERERARGDRRIGMAEQQAARIHTLLAYDLRIDTSVTPPEEAAARIVARLG